MPVVVLVAGRIAHDLVSHRQGVGLLGQGRQEGGELLDLEVVEVETESPLATPTSPERVTGQVERTSTAAVGTLGLGGRGCFICGMASLGISSSRSGNGHHLTTGIAPGHAWRKNKRHECHARDVNMSENHREQPATLVPSAW